MSGYTLIRMKETVSCHCEERSDEAISLDAAREIPTALSGLAMTWLPYLRNRKLHIGYRVLFCR